MSDSSAEVALLQSRLQSLERDLLTSNRRLEAKEDELQQAKHQHARREREWEDEKAVMEGRIHIAEAELAKIQTAASRVPGAAGRKAPPIPPQIGSPTSPSASTSPGVSPPSIALPLRPLLPYTEDSPFYRREEGVFAGKVNHLSTRLKKIVGKAKEFSLATQKFAETAQGLSAELSAPWSDVEGGLDAIIASAVQTQADQTGGPAHPARSPADHRNARSSIIQTEELVSLSRAFGQLANMLATVNDIGSNLGMSVDAFLVSALMDFRTKHIQSVLEKEVALKKAQEEYEAAFVKRLNKKREKSVLGGLMGIVTEKQKKKAAQEEEEIRSQILVCSSLRKSYELLRFDYVSLLNEVLLERRMELIEMVCASFLGFVSRRQPGERERRHARARGRLYAHREGWDPLSR